MLPIGSRNRLLVGLAAIFLLINLVYLVIRVLIPALAVPVTLGAAVCLLVFIMYRWQVKVPHYDEQIRDLKAQLNLSPLMGSLFLPYGFWAMEPVALVEILSYIQLNRSLAIIECGAGLSTILIGKLLKQQQNGHLFALEEDPHWYAVISRLLEQEQLEPYVTLICAPLEPWTSMEKEKMLWYASESVDTIKTAVQQADLVVVDGPKSSNELSRYPALPALASLLRPETLIVLDDANRAQEQAVMTRWRREFPITVEMRHTSRGQAYIRLNEDLEVMNAPR